MDDQQQNLNDAEISLRESMNKNPGVSHAEEENTAAAKAMIIAPLILSILIALLFLFVSRTRFPDDESGLTSLIAVLFIGGLLGLSLIVTAVCLISGFAILIRAHKK